MFEFIGDDDIVWEMVFLLVFVDFEDLFLDCLGVLFYWILDIFFSMMNKFY